MSEKKPHSPVPADPLNIRVKPLEWVDRGGYGNTFDAKALGYDFCIHQVVEGGTWHLWVEKLKTYGQTKHDTLEAAKSAAQELCKKLLLEAVEYSAPQTSVESPDADADDLARAAHALLNNLWGKVYSGSRTHEENWGEFERRFPGARLLNDVLKAHTTSESHG